MATSLPEGGNDTEGTDFLATQRVFGAGRPGVGLDVLATKIAVDFQGLTSEGGDSCIKRNLDALREAAELDAICIVLFNNERTVIERVASSTAMFTPFDPQVMKGDSLDRIPWLASGLGHMRIAEIRDTLTPRREQVVDAARFAELNMRSVLLCGLSLRDRVHGFMAFCSTQPRASWDANLHLLLKLIGTSFATGLERLRVERHLSRLEERNALSLDTANDGLWDFDVDNNTVYFSPRWRNMLGFDDTPEISPDWRRLVHPDDMGRVQTMIREHIAGKTTMFESVHRMRHCNGEWRWVVSRAKARADSSGRLKRQMHGADRRRSVLELSAKGYKVYDEVAPLALAYEQRLLEGLGAEERAALDRLLTTMEEREAATRA
jgi:PAS domain S-box-containing protein